MGRDNFASSIRVWGRWDTVIGKCTVPSKYHHVDVRKYCLLPLLGVFQERRNRKGGTASLRSRTCVKRNAVFGALFKGLSLYFLYKKGNLIRIKTGLDTYLIRIQTRTPLSRYPPYDYSNSCNQTKGVVQERPLLRRALRKILENAFEKVLRRVLRIMKWASS